MFRDLLLSQNKKSSNLSVTAVFLCLQLKMATI